MPELSDDMYCSQQIMVPPMFPYLLRQYAKAAIRSQPTDLLRWSTAYFRCLSLNLPPPVKPRLEYPIPKDYDGITPGWLRALLYQFHGTSTVGFKVLWDRWIGACLHHHTLIKVLCLGGFDDPPAVPFLRFLALCCGFISENLTQTMVMVCEVLTEEPEGGSAMVPLETFVDLYKFLAAIDASRDQVLVNRYFTDDLLDLLEKKERKAKEAEPPPQTEAVKEETPEPETVEEEEKPVEVNKDDISCPDLRELPADADESSEDTTEAEKKSSRETVFEHVKSVEPPPVSGEVGANASVSEFNIKEEPASRVASPLTIDLSEQTLEEKAVKVEGATEGEAPVAEATTEEAAPAKEPSQAVSTRTSATQKGAEEDLNRYMQEVGGGEETSAATTVRDEGLRSEEEISLAPFSESLVEEGSESTESKVELEEIEVEAIPGIGGIVPPELVKAVVGYMKKCAARQHGMVMPRNIRHYSCPPLEVLD